MRGWIAAFVLILVVSISISYVMISPEIGFAAFAGRYVLFWLYSLVSGVLWIVVTLLVATASVRVAGWLTREEAVHLRRAKPGLFDEIKKDLEDSGGGLAFGMALVVNVVVYVAYLRLGCSLFWTLFVALATSLCTVYGGLVRQYRDLERWDAYHARRLTLPYLGASLLATLLGSVAVYLTIYFNARMNLYLGMTEAQSVWPIRWTLAISRPILDHPPNLFPVTDIVESFLWAGAAGAAVAWFTPLMARRDVPGIIANVVGFGSPIAIEYVGKAFESYWEGAREYLHHIPTVAFSLSLALICERIIDRLRKPFAVTSCAKCGFELNEGGRYCPNCGAAALSANGAGARDSVQIELAAPLPPT